MQIAAVDTTVALVRQQHDAAVRERNASLAAAWALSANLLMEMGQKMLAQLKEGSQIVVVPSGVKLS